MTEVKPPEQIGFTIPIAPITKKNSQRILINRSTGRPFVAPSQQYKNYEQAAGWFMPKVKAPIAKPVNVAARFYLPTRRRTDLVNLEEALLDVMVRYAVLADDNSNIVVSMDGSKVLYDKENPRTEVTITFISDGAVVE